MDNQSLKSLGLFTFCILAAVLLIALVGRSIGPNSKASPETTPPRPVTAAELYDRLTLGLPVANVEDILGEPTRNVSSVPMFQLWSYPEGTDIIMVQMDQQNEDHLWRLSDVFLYSDVSAAQPSGVLRRIKYGPFPSPCASCTR